MEQNYPYKLPSDQIVLSGNMWEDLPVEIVIRIFFFLNLEDRLNASCVCKKWSQVFHSPEVWRCMTCGFYGESSLVQQCGIFPSCCAINAVKFASLFGRHLWTLQIVGEVFTKEECVSVGIQMASLFKMLRESGCQLTCLSLWGFKYHKWKDHCCDFLSLSIEKFLRFQTRLQYFEISWNLPLCYGVHLLEALAQQCSITVNNLLLIDFCDPRRQVYKNVAYQDLMRRWDHLNSISLSYNAISEEVILTLAKSNGLILKHLSVECCYWNARTHSISSSVWLEVKKLAPNLQVDFLLMEIPKFSDIQELLPNGMPLRKLTFNTGYNVEERTYWNLNSFIKYISNNFCNSLEILKLFIENNSEIDESIVYLMISCRNVKSLKICAMLKLQTIDSLCKLREENKLGQEILHLDVRDLDMPSEERNDILCIEELLQTKIEIQGFTLRIHVY